MSDSNSMKKRKLEDAQASKSKKGGDQKEDSDINKKNSKKKKLQSKEPSKKMSQQSTQKEEKQKGNEAQKKSSKDLEEKLKNIVEPDLANFATFSSNWKKIQKKLPKKKYIPRGKKGEVEKDEKVEDTTEQVDKEDEDNEDKDDEEEEGTKVEKPKSGEAASFIHLQPHSIPEGEDTSRPTKKLTFSCSTVEVDDQTFASRVVILNSYGHVILDKRVEPPVKVHGPAKKAFENKNAKPFKEVQKEVSDLLKGKILIGYGLDRELKTLFLSHPFKATRDIARYRPIHGEEETLSISQLAKKILGTQMKDNNNPVEKTKVLLGVYNEYKKEWEEKVNRKLKKITIKKNMKLNEKVIASVKAGMH